MCDIKSILYNFLICYFILIKIIRSSVIVLCIRVGGWVGEWWFWYLFMVFGLFLNMYIFIKFLCICLYMVYV